MLLWSRCIVADPTAMSSWPDLYRLYPDPVFLPRRVHKKYLNPRFPAYFTVNTAKSTGNVEFEISPFWSLFDWNDSSNKPYWVLRKKWGISWAIARDMAFVEEKVISRTVFLETTWIPSQQMLLRDTSTKNTRKRMSTVQWYTIDDKVP